VFVNVTGNVHREYMRASGSDKYAVTQAHTRTRASLVAAADMLLLHEGQGRDNYGIRGIPAEEENICVYARGKRTVLLEMRCRHVHLANRRMSKLSIAKLRRTVEISERIL